MPNKGGKVIDSKKVEFVKNNYPQIHNVNPYVQPSFVSEVKERLIKEGFYQPTARHHYNDTSIINIILVAQGKKIFNRTISSRRKKYGRTK